MRSEWELRGWSVGVGTHGPGSLSCHAEVFNIEEDNEAQKLVRIMGGNEFTLERCFKAAG